MKLLQKFFPFILLSPAFFWLLFHPGSILAEIAKSPGYIKANISNVFAPDRLMAIEEMRWNAFGPEKEELGASLVYNKGFVLVDNFFSFVAFLSPRYYFQSGDGTNFSPPGVNPISGVLFFSWVLGMIYFLGKKNMRIFWTVLIFGAFAFLAGKRNFAFLFPVLLIYLFISYKGTLEIPPKLRRNFLIGFFIYGLFQLGRMLWGIWTKS